MSGAILVLNSGSSSIKFGLFALTGKGDPNLPCKGLLDEQDATPRLTIKDASGDVLFDPQSRSAPRPEQGPCRPDRAVPEVTIRKT
jgi:acetate kinase